MTMDVTHKNSGSGRLTCTGARDKPAMEVSRYLSALALRRAETKTGERPRFETVKLKDKARKKKEQTNKQINNKAKNNELPILT